MHGLIMTAMAPPTCAKCVVNLTLHAHAKELHGVLHSKMQLNGLQLVNQKIALKKLNNHTDHINIFKVPASLPRDDLHVTTTYIGVEKQATPEVVEIVETPSSFDIKVQWDAQHFTLKLLKGDTVPSTRNDAHESHDTTTAAPVDHSDIMQWCSRVQSTGQRAVDLERAETIVTHGDIGVLNAAAGTATPSLQGMQAMSPGSALKQFCLLDAIYMAAQRQTQAATKQEWTVYGFETLLDVSKCQCSQLDMHTVKQVKTCLAKASNGLEQAMLIAPSDDRRIQTSQQSPEYHPLFLLQQSSGLYEAEKRAAQIDDLQKTRHRLTHALAAWHTNKHKNSRAGGSYSSHFSYSNTSNPMSVRYTRQLYNAMLACDSAIRMQIYAGLGIESSPTVAERHHNVYRAAFARAQQKQDHAHLELKTPQVSFLETTFGDIFRCLPQDVAPNTHPSTLKLHALEVRIVCANYILACMRLQQARDNTLASGYALATHFNYTYSNRNRALLQAQHATARNICMHVNVPVARKHAALWLQRILQLDCEHKLIHRKIMQTCMSRMHEALHCDNTDESNTDFQKVYQLFAPAAQPIAALVLFGQERPAVFAFMANHEFALYNHEAKAKMTLDLLCEPLP